MQFADKGSITHEELLAAILYDPETGMFWNRERRSNAMPNAVAGYWHQPSGYWLITIGWRKYKAHRLAWFYIYEEWPIEIIDHINGDRSDNRLENLREATFSENLINSEVRIDNSSGYKGVYFEKRIKKWRAYINKNGRRHFLGHFDRVEDAALARQKAEVELFGQFSRNN